LRDTAKDGIYYQLNAFFAMQACKHLKAVLVLVGSILLIVLFYALTPAPSVNIVVSFVGFTNDSAGAPMTIFSVTNRGNAKVVIWGYYKIDAKQDFRILYPTIFGNYDFLMAGQSQTVIIHTPETKGPWKVSIGYGNYNLQCRWVYFAGHLPSQVLNAIPERFLDVPKELAASDWIK
jgi:hypothetical protein